MFKKEQLVKSFNQQAFFFSSVISIQYKKCYYNGKKIALTKEEKGFLTKLYTLPLHPQLIPSGAKGVKTHSRGE